MEAKKKNQTKEMELSYLSEFFSFLNLCEPVFMSRAHAPNEFNGLISTTTYTLIVHSINTYSVTWPTLDAFHLTELIGQTGHL